jgi:hypothetical protein
MGKGTHDKDIAEAESTLAKLGGFAPQRHIFICADSDKDKCCSAKDSDAAGRS